MNKCTTDGCDQKSFGMFEAGDIYSWHCQDCLSVFQVAKKVGIVPNLNNNKSVKITRANLERAIGNYAEGIANLRTSDDSAQLRYARRRELQSDLLTVLDRLEFAE